MYIYIRKRDTDTDKSRKESNQSKIGIKYYFLLLLLFTRAFTRLFERIEKKNTICTTTLPKTKMTALDLILWVEVEDHKRHYLLHTDSCPQIVYSSLLSFVDCCFCLLNYYDMINFPSATKTTIKFDFYFRLFTFKLETLTSCFHSLVQQEKYESETP